MQLKLNKKTSEKILKWGWNIVFLYMLIAVSMIIIDVNNNPELYNEGSDCKPLVNLLDKFDRYVSPVWTAFIILVIISYIINVVGRYKKNKDQKIWKIIQFIRSWCWNLFFIYAVVGSFLIMNDAENNPEMYYALESRPNNIQGENIYISVNPEWHYRASTIQECKPMMNLLDKFDRYVSPAWLGFTILVILTLINVFLEPIKKAVKKMEE